MDNSQQPSPGIFASVRRIADTLLSTIQNRVELFALELEEEKHWLIATLLWSAGAIFFGVLAVTFFTLTVIVLSPDNAKPWLLVVFCILYLCLFAAAALGLRKLLKSKTPPMADTLSELKKDLSWLRAKD